MRTGRKVIAYITAQDGKPMVDMRDSNGYTSVALEDGSIAIVESESQQFYEIGEVTRNDAERT